MIIGQGLPLHPRRAVTAQCQHIFYTRALHIRKGLADRLFCRSHAGQMRDGWHVILFLNTLRDGNSMFAGASPCTIGHAHITRMQRRHIVRRFFHTLKIRVSFRRKYLKGERQFFFPQNRI